MSSKFLTFLAMSVGSIIGGYIPSLFGAGLFSLVSVLTSGIGAIIGIFIAYKLSNY